MEREREKEDDRDKEELTRTINREKDSHAIHIKCSDKHSGKCFLCLTKLN